MELNEYNKIISRFDTDITSHVKLLKERISEIKFDTENATQFILSAEFDSSVFSKTHKKGIYMFELNLE